MFTTTKLFLQVTACGALFALNTYAVSADPTRYGFGEPASANDLQDFVSSLPDGRDLPAGSGTISKGKQVYDEKCASCHGQKLEGDIGDRLIGGRGTLVNNDPKKAPVKTVESYWPYATTLFDYIKRAMPFYTPGSLTNDEVYSVTGYILSEAKILNGDEPITAKSLSKVAMPNRNGFIPDHRPDHFKPADKHPRLR
ncbi:MAG: cytochrome c [Rhizobium sp.]|jgi:cytochrome c|uniref:c-type cytochrome n=1 Tax=Thiobacillus sp. TaxID=924 RepID=UPI0025FFABF1|nr:cytochrome c [Thiobacillus sp.]MBW8363632.1 cytochrome c [Rhizobium sp.]